MVSDAHPDSTRLSRGSSQSRDVSRRDKEEISKRQHTLIWKSAWAGLGSLHVRAQVCCSPVTEWNNDDESAENKRKKLQQGARSNTLRQMCMKMQDDHETGEVESTGDIKSLFSVITARLAFPWNRGEWCDSGLGAVKRDTSMFALFMAAVPPETASADVLFSPYIIYKESPPLNEH